MSVLMERVRVTYDLPEDVRRGIAIYAAEQGISFGQAVEQFANDAIPSHIEQARRAIEAGDRPPPKKGRPPRKRD